MEGVWDPLGIPLEPRGAAMGASSVCTRGAEERVGGWGSLFFFLGVETKRVGVGGGGRCCSPCSIQARLSV